MKISYKNTALKLLEGMTPFDFTISEDKEHSPIEYKRQVGLSLVREWPKMAPLFKKKIQYISDPFYDAYNMSTSKLADVIDAEPIEESGTFISKASHNEYNTIFYSIKTEGKGADFKINYLILFFSKMTNKEKPTFNILIHKRPEWLKVFMSEVAHTKGVTDISIAADLLTLILFMKYVDLETKVVRGEKKEMHSGIKYVNETKADVEILDSTWFTTIVRSEGFKVGGHFRMQPHGPNLSQRKLIWISDFDKHGYVRRAKILNQHE